MIFPNVIAEPIVQINDKTRIDCSKSFVSKDENAVTEVTIEPETGSGAISVFNSAQKEWYLDWQYSTAGTKTITVEITTDGLPVSYTHDIEIVTSATDKLFSDDSFLQRHESDIMRYVPKGRNTFLNVHRQAQERILAYLEECGFSANGQKITKDNVVNLDEVRQWSGYLTLHLIFNDLWQDPDDALKQKADDYLSKADNAKNRAHLRLDTNGDGNVDAQEGIQMRSLNLIRG